MARVRYAGRKILTDFRLERRLIQRVLRFRACRVSRFGARSCSGQNRLPCDRIIPESTGVCIKLGAADSWRRAAGRTGTGAGHLEETGESRNIGY